MLRAWITFNAFLHVASSLVILFAPAFHLQQWGLPLALTEPASILLSFYGLLELSIGLFFAALLLADETTARRTLLVLFPTNLVALYISWKAFHVFTGAMYCSAFFMVGSVYFAFVYRSLSKK